jgi:glyceraldehyde-3-phosphate dehydrogenase/erythrose-4-phosphate dehydrogenase
MLQFDTVHGRWKECREAADGNSFTVEGKTVTFSEKKTIAEVDWKVIARPPTCVLSRISRNKQQR